MYIIVHWYTMYSNSATFTWRRFCRERSFGRNWVYNHLFGAPTWADLKKGFPEIRWQQFVNKKTFDFSTCFRFQEKHFPSSIENLSHGNSDPNWHTTSVVSPAAMATRSWKSNQLCNDTGLADGMGNHDPWNPWKTPRIFWYNVVRHWLKMK